MSPIKAVGSALRKYAVFSGRARRSEFWWFTAFVILVAVITLEVDIFFFGPDFDDPTPVSTVASLALFLPHLGVSVRRLHDLGRTGWWVLLNALPLIGTLVLIVWFCFDSRADNRWGLPPE